MEWPRLDLDTRELETARRATAVSSPEGDPRRLRRGGDPDQGSHLLVGRGQIGGRRVRLLREAIDGDRFPLSPRVQVWRAILARLRPELERPAALPAPKVYAPPSRGRYRRRG